MSQQDARVRVVIAGIFLLIAGCQSAEEQAPQTVMAKKTSAFTICSAPFDKQVNLSTQRTTTTQGWTAKFTYTGTDTGIQWGVIMGLAGADLNQDGFSDLVIGRVGDDSTSVSNHGGVYVVYGPVQGEYTFDEIPTSTLGGSYLVGDVRDWGLFGTKVVVGNFNGDSYPDLLLTGHGTNPYSADTSDYLGSAFQLNGSGSKLPTGRVRKHATHFVDNFYSGTQTMFGFEAAAGDLNGDGIDDLIVTAFEAKDSAHNSIGKVYIYYGPSLPDSYNPGTADVIIDGHKSGTSVSNLGSSVAVADFNGDGCNDLIIGAKSDNGQGAVYVLFQPKATLAASVTCLGFGTNQNTINTEDVALGLVDGIRFHTDTAYKGSEGGGRIGFTAAKVGDMDQDGYDDIIVGAYGHYGYDGTDYSYGHGAVYLIYGGPRSKFSNEEDLEALLSKGAHRWVGTVDLEKVGIGLAPAGDIDGDGYPDILVGTQQNRNSSSGVIRQYPGHSYLIFGRKSRFLGSTSLVPTSGVVEFVHDTELSRGDNVKVAGVGDVDGDGFDDLLIGTENNDDGTRGSTVYLVRGGCRKAP